MVAIMRAMYRYPQLRAEIIDVSVNTLRQWEKDGRFPRSRKIGPRAKAWAGSELKIWLEKMGIPPRIPVGV
jgi:predicted DNA-binding transcriptional regulator AlpA